MAKSPEEMAEAMIANLKDKTGKTLNQWLAVAKKMGVEKHGQIVKGLKTEHALTHGYANLIAHKYLKSDAGSQSDEGADLVAAQYAGAKAALLPIYEALLKVISALGKGIEIAPKKTYVSVRRNKQFALIQPSTKTRVDLGINLKDVAPTGKLEASGSFNSMVSHRIRLESPKDIDRDVQAWLKKAYEQA